MASFDVPERPSLDIVARKWIRRREARFGTMNAETILKHFEAPDEVREFALGKLELVTINGQTFGRATYQPGWKWSTHVGPGVGAERCHIEHLGLVLRGHATAAFDD